MSCFTGLTKNEALKRVKELCAFVGGFTSTEKAVTGQVSQEIVKMAAGHGLVAGQWLELKTLTGGVTGLVEGRAYIVKETKGTEEIVLAMRKEGPTTAWTGTLTPGTVFYALVEISGGSPAYARVATGFGEPSQGIVEDTTGRVLNIPAATTISHIGFWKLGKAEAGDELMGLFRLASPEAFTEKGTYTVTLSQFDDVKTIA